MNNLTEYEASLVAAFHRALRSDTPGRVIPPRRGFGSVSSVVGLIAAEWGALRREARETVHRDLMSELSGSVSLFSSKETASWIKLLRLPLAN